MNELISVIIPVYKVEPFLEKCIKSVLEQTYKNFEVILVDDGSPDCCPQICDLWEQRDSRIHVIHQKMVEEDWREIKLLIFLGENLLHL